MINEETATTANLGGSPDAAAKPISKTVKRLNNSDTNTEKRKMKIEELFQIEMGIRIVESDEYELTDNDAVIAVQLAAMAVGGDFEYADGVYDITLRHAQQVHDLCDKLDELDGVAGYEVAIHRKDGKNINTEHSVDDIDELSTDEYEFSVIAYLEEDSIAYYSEDDFEDEVNEVRRRIKVNSQGKRRIKMQCRPGFKWDGSACVKISGAELATNRRARRKSIITKKSQGSALKLRVLRKTRKANRFRKSMGLK